MLEFALKLENLKSTHENKNMPWTLKNIPLICKEDYHLNQYGFSLWVTCAYVTVLQPDTIEFSYYDPKEKKVIIKKDIESKINSWKKRIHDVTCSKTE